MAAHNLLIKANTIESAVGYVDEYLSIPAVSARELGYNEVMVMVEGDDLTDKLHKWHTDTRPHDGDPFVVGALIWWQS